MATGVVSTMTTITVKRVGAARSFLWGTLLAALWVIVALLRPASTFHLAPFLVAAAPPVLMVLDDQSSADRTSVLLIGAASAALALLTALALSTVGAMQGPAFNAFSSPLAEASVFTAVGAIGGVGFARLRIR